MPKEPKGPKQPEPRHDPLHDPPAPPLEDPPDKPMHDPAGDPTYEPQQPFGDPAPTPDKILDRKIRKSMRAKCVRIMQHDRDRRRLLSL